MMTLQVTRFRIAACWLPTAFLMLSARAAAADATTGGQRQTPDLTPVAFVDAASHPPVELVRDGKALAVVYVAAPQPSAKLQRLVNELVTVVELTSGAKLTVATGAPTTDQPAIIIGDCEQSRQAGIDAARLPAEGFVIKTAPNRVFLVGSTQALPPGGTELWANEADAWAVADFLERFISVRWYWPASLGGRSIKANRTINIGPAHYQDQPVFRLRGFHPPYGWKLPARPRLSIKEPLPFPEGAIPAGVDKIDMPDYLPLVRAGNSWPYVVRVHEPQGHHRNPGKWADKAYLFRKNEDGTPNFKQLCYSEPRTLEYLLEGCADAWDHGKPVSWVTSTSVTVSPSDSMLNCACEACQKAIKEGGEVKASLLMGRFVLKMCQAVKERWPDKKVLYLPYWNYQKAPKGLEFPDNLEVMVCTTGEPMALRKQPGTRKALDANLAAWSKLAGGRITNWDYSDRGSGWTYAPMQYPNLIVDFYRSRQSDLIGTFINGGAASDWTTTAPTMYVWMKALWNPQLNAEAIFDEMCQRMFGNAAGTTREMLRVETQLWEDGKWGGQGDNGVFTPKQFNSIWTPQTVAQLRDLRERAMKELAGDPVGRQRLLYWTWTFESFLTEAAEAQGEHAADRDIAVTPDQSIQTALDAAKPGDTVSLAPGVYHQRVQINNSGTAEAPITLRAREPGTVTLSGAATERLAFEPVGDDVYAASVPWEVLAVMVDGRKVMSYPSVDDVRRSTVRSQSGPMEGYHWNPADKRLYLKLFAGGDPRKRQVFVSDQHAAGRKVDNRDSDPRGQLIRALGSHVAIEGLKLHLAPDIGVLIEGDHVAVRDCFFSGTWCGIVNPAGASARIEHNEFTGYPNYQNQRLLQAHGKDSFKLLYSDSTFLRGIGPGTTVRHNYIAESWDGVQYGRNSKEAQLRLPSDFSYNFLQNCADDAIEFDSVKERAWDSRVHHNVLLDNFCSLGISPKLHDGDLMIDHNLVLVSPEYGMLYNVMLKLHNPWRAKRPFPTHDVRLVHNLFANSKYYLAWGQPLTPNAFENMTFQNNRVYLGVRTLEGPDGEHTWEQTYDKNGFPLGANNVIGGPALQSGDFPRLVHAPEKDWPLTDTFARANGLPLVLPAGMRQVPHNRVVGEPRNPTALPASRFHLELTEGSVAVDAGQAGREQEWHHPGHGKAPDCGPLELGQQWEFPAPGPRWIRSAKDAPWRVPLPPSFDPAWIGMTSEHFPAAQTKPDPMPEMRPDAQLMRLLDHPSGKIIVSPTHPLLPTVVFVSGRQPLTNSDLAGLEKASSLVELDLSNAGITDDLRMGRYPHLERAQLGGTQIGDKVLTKIVESSPLLDRLSVDNTKVTDAGFANIARLTKLRSLVIRGTGVGDAAAGEIAKLPMLEGLDAAGCPFTRAGLKALAASKSLKKIKIGVNKAITDADISAVQAMNPNLKITQ